MGYPIRTTFGDLLNNRFLIEGLRPDLYAFILYKSEHVLFRNYVMDNFDLYADRGSELRNGGSRFRNVGAHSPELWLIRSGIFSFTSR